MAAKKSKSSGGLPWFITAPFTFVCLIVALLVKGLWWVLKRVTPSRERLAGWWAAPSVRTGLIVVCATLVFAGLLFWMRVRLTSDDAYRIDPARVSFASDLTWANGACKEHIEAVLRADIGARVADVPATHAFDGEILAQVARAVESSPWVSGLVRVERRFPGEHENSALHVEFLVRRPVLLAECSGSLYLVDRDAVVLPLVVACRRGEPDDEIGKRILEGLSASIRRVTGLDNSTPVIGRPWRNEQVLAALSVEQELRAHSVDGYLPIREVNVADIAPERDWARRVVYAPSGGVRLFPATAASVIVWGKAPIHATAAEPSVETKLERLSILLERDPTLTERRYDLNTALRS